MKKWINNIRSNIKKNKEQQKAERRLIAIEYRDRVEAEKKEREKRKRFEAEDLANKLIIDSKGKPKDLLINVCIKLNEQDEKIKKLQAEVDRCEKKRSLHYSGPR